jgi:WD40 repeat protein
MTACPPEDLLQRLLEGGLTAAERDPLEEHLPGCDACRAALDRLSGGADTERWRRCQAGQPADPSGQDAALLRHVAALGAALLDCPSLPATVLPLVRAAERPNDTEVGPWPKPRPRAGAPLPTVPGYDILEEVGRGGMAVVYRARQVSLNRVVALKMILAGAHATAQERDFFRAEAEAIARLHHPHIVQIFEVGEHNGLPYLCLEYLAGGSLAAYLAGAPQPPRAAAGLLAPLARAAQFAHEHGVVHRDLKPANVLLAACGLDQDNARPQTACVPKIADFGLAKRLDGAQTLLASGTVAGTPNYMAPEQAAGPSRLLGPAVDVYALGALLYEALTGQAPFRGQTAYETLLQVVHGEPVPPRQLQPAVPRDLETVCLKCLHKDPQKRYPSALALAEDLESFLAGRPIAARPVGPWGRAAKWARRRPAVATLLALVVALTAVGFGLLWGAWVNAEARAEAEKTALEETGRRERQERDARREVERLTARLTLDQGTGLCERGEVGAGLLFFARGVELAARAGDADLERALRVNLSGWRGRLIRERAAFPHKGWVVSVAFRPPRGDVVATASADRTVRLWDAVTGKPLGEPWRHDFPVTCLAFSPDGKKALAGCGRLEGEPPGPRQVVLWDVGTGKELKRWRTPAGVTKLAFSRAGDRLLYVSPPSAQLWDAETLRHVADLGAHGPVLTAAFSPDGKTLATGGFTPPGSGPGRGLVRLWDAAGGQPRGGPLPHPSPLLGAVDLVGFSGDGRTVAAACRVKVTDQGAGAKGVLWGEVRTWDTAGGRPAGPVLVHRGRVLDLKFSPDGGTLATGSSLLEAHPKPGDPVEFRPLGGEARLWEVRTGRLIARPLPHPWGVMALDYSPDGRLLLTGCEDLHARLFEAASGALLGKALPHEGAVMSVAFSPDGKMALTGSAGGDHFSGASARLWELPPDVSEVRTLPTPSLARPLAFSRDGALLLAGGSRDHLVRRWDVRAGREVGPALAHEGVVQTLAMGPDDRSVLTGSDLKGRPGGQARLWERATGRLRVAFPHDDRVMLAALSPDGRTLLTATDQTENAVHLWDVASARRLEKHLLKGKVVLVGYHGAGEAVWLENDGRATRLWRRGRGAKAELVWQQPLGVWDAGWCREGKAILVVGPEHCPQLLDARTGRPEGPALPRHIAAIRATAAAPDGRTLLTGGQDRLARLWDAATGKPLGPPLAHSDWVSDVAFHPDGRLFATSDERGVYLWRIPAPVEGSPERIRCWAEALTGLELDDRGTVRGLSAADLEERQRRLGELRGSPRAGDAGVWLP